MSLPALAEALYVEEVTRARLMRPEDKLLEGPRLFERACRLMADGVRHQHPELEPQYLALRLLGFATQEEIGRQAQGRLGIAPATGQHQAILHGPWRRPFFGAPHR